MSKLKYDISEENFKLLYNTLIDLNHGNPIREDWKDKTYTPDEVRDNFYLIASFFEKVILSGEDNTWFKIVDKLNDEYYVTMILCVSDGNKEFIISKKRWRTAFLSDSEGWKWNNIIIIKDLKQ